MALDDFLTRSWYIFLSSIIILMGICQILLQVRFNIYNTLNEKRPCIYFGHVSDCLNQQLLTSLFTEYPRCFLNQQPLEYQFCALQTELFVCFLYLNLQHTSHDMKLWNTPHLLALSWPTASLYPWCGDHISSPSPGSVLASNGLVPLIWWSELLSISWLCPGQQQACVPDVVIIAPLHLLALF